MKLRVRKNSIRLRLSSSEVRQFRENGYIEEAIEFGAGSRFNYALAIAETNSINARFENGKITVFVPPSEAESWTSSNEIGLENKQSIGDDKFLKILIEKDLAPEN